MMFTRESFEPGVRTAKAGPPDACNPDLAWLARGNWLVEAGSVPPHSHRPESLLAGFADRGATAISLRSATVLAFDLGPKLVAWLAREGCLLPDHARLALHEIILNAAIHGNLEVTSGRAASWSDLAARETLIEAALADPLRASRVVTVALGWTSDRVAAVVADEGLGYQPAPGPHEMARRGAGRGLLIARAAAQVEVLNGGRCTRLVFAPRIAAPA